MAAKIIPFPGFMQRHFTLHRRDTKAPVWRKHTSEGEEGLHLVEAGVPHVPGASPAAYRASQQQALRIVEEVQQEWNERHSARAAQPVTQTDSAPQRKAQLWSSRPIVPGAKETPLSVARRLMHMLLSTAETA